MTYIKPYNPSHTQKLVLDKYGWETIGRKVAMETRYFWRQIHGYFLGSDVPDNSDIDIDYLIYGAVLDYLFQNDVELQEEYEKELADDIPY